MSARSSAPTAGARQGRKGETLATGCSACGARIVLVTLAGDTDPTPIDPDLDQDGPIVRRPMRESWIVWAVEPGDDLDPAWPRHRRHRDGCPGTTASRRVGPLGPCQGTGCRAVTRRYGQGGSPLCDTCTAALEEWRAAPAERRRGTAPPTSSDQG